MSFYSEAYKKSLFSYDEEIYKPYLEKETVLSGTFQFWKNF